MGSLSYISLANYFFQKELVTYCAKDTAATQEVFAALWPKFLDRFPHPVSFAGMLEMGSAYLPVNQSWENYIRDADNTYDDLENEMKCSLMKLADDTCNYLHGKRFGKSRPMLDNPRQSWILNSTLWIPDNNYWILDSLSVEFRFWIRIVSRFLNS